MMTKEYKKSYKIRENLNSASIKGKNGNFKQLTLENTTQMGITGEHQRN